MMEYHVKMSPLFNLSDESEKFYRMYLVNSMNNPEVHYCISELEGVPTGYVRGSITHRAPIFEKRRIGMINEIYVQPEFRGAGAGRGLTEGILSWFNDKGIELSLIHI